MNKLMSIEEVDALTNGGSTDFYVVHGMKCSASGVVAMLGQQLLDTMREVERLRFALQELKDYGYLEHSSCASKRGNEILKGARDALDYSKHTEACCSYCNGPLYYNGFPDGICLNVTCRPNPTKTLEDK